MTILCFVLVLLGVGGFVPVASAQTPRLITKNGTAYLTLGKDRLLLVPQTYTPPASPWHRTGDGGAIRLLPSGQVQAVGKSGAIETRTAEKFEQSILDADPVWRKQLASSKEVRRQSTMDGDIRPSVQVVYPFVGQVYGIVTFFDPWPTEKPIVAQFFVRFRTAPLAVDIMRRLKPFSSGGTLVNPNPQLLRQKDRLLIFEHGGVLSLSASGDVRSAYSLPAGVWPSGGLAFTGRWLPLATLYTEGPRVGYLDLVTGQSQAFPGEYIFPLRDSAYPAREGMLVKRFPSDSDDGTQPPTFTFVSLPSRNTVRLSAVPPKNSVYDGPRLWRGLIVWVERSDDGKVADVVCVDSRTGRPVKVAREVSAALMSSRSTRSTGRKATQQAHRRLSSAA